MSDASSIAVSFAGDMKGQPIQVYHRLDVPSEGKSFTYVGVDFAGPLYTRTMETQSDKVWICLFTCCVIRAIHLEVVNNLSTEAFIRCLKLFAARKGMPRKFILDSGKTFVAAAKFLKTVFRDSLVQDHLAGVYRLVVREGSMVGWGIRANGEVYKTLPKEDGQIYPERASHSCGGD